MLEINNVSDISDKELQIINYNNSSIYNIKILNENFIINPKISFSNCSAFFQKLYKIRINIDISNSEQLCFRKLLDIIHKKVYTELENDGHCIEFLQSINNPVLKSNTLYNTDIIHCYMNKSTTFIEYGTNTILDITELLNKRFDIRPIINSPVLNVKNAIYINYYIRTAYIRFNTSLDFISNTELDKIFKK
jgi:hypothetical protein